MALVWAKVVTQSASVRWWASETSFADRVLVMPWAAPVLALALLGPASAMVTVWTVRVLARASE